MIQRFFEQIRNILTRIFRNKRNSRISETDTAAQAERQLVHSLAKSRLPGWRQLRYLPKVLSPSERFLLRAFGGFLAIALIFLGARAYARNVVQLPRDGGEITEALIGAPQYVNPILASANDVDRDLVRLLYSGLLRRNQQQEIVPDIAESIEHDAGQKAYTVHLRKNLAWSDGQPLTIDDVLTTFELIQDPLYKSPLRGQFRNATIERVDDWTIKFTHTQSAGSFLSSLTVGIIPAHIWADVPPPNFALLEFNLKPVSYGPFSFDSLKRDAASGAIKEFRLVRNASYHGTRPHLDRLTFKIFPDPVSAAEALEAKSVEGISALSKEERIGLKQARIVDLELPQYTAVFLNIKRGVLKYPEVRTALAQAVDRQRIVNDVLKNSAVVVDGMFADRLPGFAGQLQPDFSLESAKAALETAGWVRPKDESIRKKGNETLAISLTVVDQAEDLAIADLLKQSWEALGAKVEIKTFDPMRIPKEVIKPRDYDAFLYGEILSTDGDLYPFWHSSQNRDPGLNISTFISKDGDKILEDLRATTDPAVITEKRIAYQKLLAESHTVIFLYSPFYTYGLAKRVKGFSLPYISAPADRFAGIENWYVKTRPSLK